MNITLHNLTARLRGLYAAYKQALRMIEPKDGENILDVGCGRGVMLEELALRYASRIKLYGIDPDPEKTEAASRRLEGKNVAIKIAYAEELPFINNSLDWVISTLVFHHLSKEEKGKAVGEIKRVLKPDGRLFICDLGRPKGILGIFLHKLSANHAFTRQNMEIVEDLLSKNGFLVKKRAITWGWIEHILAQKTLSDKKMAQQSRF